MVWQFQDNAVVLATAVALTACGGEDVDEAGARTLLAKIQMEDYESWQTAPGYDTPQDTIRAHGGTAQVFVNSVMEAAISGPPIEAWPAGSLIVKNSFDGGSLSLIAAMEKQAGSWFYAEWDADLDVKFAGEPEVCVNCHSAGDDSILVVALPTE
jgi:hypothetical protein